MIIKFSLGFFATVTTFNTHLLTGEFYAPTLAATTAYRLFSPSSTIASGLISYRQKTEKKTETEANTDTEEPLDFSSLGRSGQQTAGESRGNCPPSEIPLTAIAPKSNDSKTITSHPKWWFYLPYNPSQISKVEFVIQDRKRNDLLRENVTLAAKQPYFRTTIPKTHSGIKPNFSYRWYLKVYCSETDDTVPLYVSGWVQRIIPQKQVHGLNQTISLTAIEYARHGLWLDAIDSLIGTETVKPRKANRARIWQQIIGSDEIDLKLPLPELIDFSY